MCCGSSASVYGAISRPSYPSFAAYSHCLGNGIGTITSLQRAIRIAISERSSAEDTADRTDERILARDHPPVNRRHVHEQREQRDSGEQRADRPREEGREVAVRNLQAAAQAL